MISIRTADEIEKMRACGRINANIHRALAAMLRPGVATSALDLAAADLMQAADARSSIHDPLGFPGAICISVNDEVGHGVPGSRVLGSGDVVKVDISIEHEGFHTDCAVTHLVGESVGEDDKALVQVTQDALWAGIREAMPRARCSNISHAIECTVHDAGLSVIRQAFGHGIGDLLHEPPMVPNFGPPQQGPRLQPGMALAIEPVVSGGSRVVTRGEDGWVDVLVDGSRAAHFEHTVLITDGVPEVLTLGAEGEASASAWLDWLREDPRVVFRPMRWADKEQVFQLIAEEMDPILMDAWGRKASPEEVFGLDARLTILEQSGRVVGFYGSSTQDGEVHLNTVVIHRSCQRKGLGKRVMHRLEAQARQAGFRSTRLCVQMNNARAMRFYERIGYRVCGEPYVNTLMMRKSLV